MKLITFVIVVSALFAFHASATDYWVASGNGRIWNNAQGIYIVRINDQGQVVSPEKNVWVNAPFNDGIPSLTNGSNNQLMVMELIRLLPIYQSNSTVTVAALSLNKNSLGATNLYFTGIVHKDGFFIQSSQKPLSNSMALNPGVADPRAYGFTPDGVITGHWRMIPRIRNLFNGANGITADGKMGWAPLFDGSGLYRIYVQPLKDSGLPNGKPGVGAVNETGFSSIDISNTLPGNVRYLVYRTSTPTGSKIELRLIDADTGRKVSQPVTIVDPSNSDFVQNIAIDPDGHFVIYKEIGDPTCPPATIGPPPNNEFPSEDIWFQKLGSGGVAVGDRIKIVDCADIPGGPAAIDIMKVQ